MSSSVTDKILLQRIHEGEPAAASAAFSELYNVHVVRIYNYARRILSGSEGSAEDVTQQVFVNFFEQVRLGKPVENVRGYLLRSTRNMCFNEFARQKPAEQFIEELYAHTLVKSYETQELIELIYSAIDKLPEEYREVVVLREQLGLPFDEIATIVGISSDNARTRLSRAMKMLRTLLVDYINDLDY